MNFWAYGSLSSRPFLAFCPTASTSNAALKLLLFDSNWPRTCTNVRFFWLVVSDSMCHREKGDGPMVFSMLFLSLHCIVGSDHRNGTPLEVACYHPPAMPNGIWMQTWIMDLNSTTMSLCCGKCVFSQTSDWVETVELLRLHSSIENYE